MAKVIDIDSKRKKGQKKRPFCIGMLEWVEFALESFPKAALLRVMTKCRKRLKELDELEKES